MPFPSNFPALDTARLRLRRLIASDVEAVFAVFSDPEVMRYWASSPMADLSEARELIARAQTTFDERAALRWGVTLRPANVVIGTVSLFRFDEQCRRAEIGYALGRAHWGKGYMSEALAAVLDLAFGALNLNRVEADIDPRNIASARTVERLGFAREGLLRERWIVQGEKSDSLMMGLLRDEWLARDRHISPS